MMKLIALVTYLTLMSLQAFESTPLDDYVNTPDPHYTYSLIQTYRMTGYTIYVLNMTSQKWLDETVTLKPIWWHYLCVTIPDKIIRPDAAFMVISNGNNNDQLPQPTDESLEISGLFAINTGSVAAVLKQIPNQPTVFLKDPTKAQRREDAVIAWTWKVFIENPEDPSILLRLPMTKAAVRGMDTIIDFVQKKGAGTIKKFMINGESKRGWTTWTTAAVDKRVFAAIPMTMDLCNLNANLHNHYKSLGNWTFAFFYYYELGITALVDSPGIFAMEKIIDPKTYFDRYRDLKIMMINTGGDELFLPDDTYLFWNDLVKATQGSVLMRRLPNAHHTFPDINMFFNYKSFFLTVYEGKPLPIVTWKFANNDTHGVIVATVDNVKGLTPRNAKVYYAKTLDSKRRDFRLYVANPQNPTTPMYHPVLWEVSWSILTTTKTSNSIIYTASMAKPSGHWLAFFIEFNFDSIENSSMTVTTEANIIPETYPYPDCTLKSCYGGLV